jgi:two-component system cell cycle response regulator
MTGADRPRGNGESHIVVANDDPRQLRALTWLLRERGYRVTSVPSRAALDALAHGETDLLLLDYGAIGSEGPQVLARLRDDERWRDMPVLVTAPAPDSTAADVAASVLRLGADDYLDRPLRVDELLARIEAQLRSHQGLREVRATLRERERELERARENVANTHELVDIVHEVTGELSPSAIYRVLARRVARALGVSHCSVVLATVGDAEGTVAVSYEDPAARDLRIALERYPEIVAALEHGRPVLVQDVRTDELLAPARERWAEERLAVRIRSTATIPFALDRARCGVLFLRTTFDERALTEEDCEFADLVVKAAISSIQRGQLLERTRADNRRLEALATTDPLTRLLNRRAFLDRLGLEVERSHRYGAVLSLLMLDVDHFKLVNDSAGHLTGDSVLGQVGALLQSAVRSVDVVARYGGEEFVVLLPETDPDGAVAFAERLRELVSAHAFLTGHGEPLHLTASIGVSSFPSPSVRSTEDLFARADEALYRAKANGRNQVRV